LDQRDLEPPDRLHAGKRRLCRCYAFALHDRIHVQWKRGQRPNAPAQYHLPFSRVQLLPKHLEDPLHWRKPRRVFVNSMSDLFHKDVPDSYIARVFAVMAKARQHTFQVLTKRPERMLQFMEGLRATEHGRLLMVEPTGASEPLAGAYLLPLPNVWLGTSVEHQVTADERIPLLLQTPAAVRFLSCEPLLAPVTLGSTLALLDWVIVGGESGEHYRPMDLDWARSIREQCQVAGVAFFFKQSSGAKPGRGRELDGRLWEEYPAC
jgi:protein gp37